MSKLNHPSGKSRASSGCSPLIESAKITELGPGQAEAMVIADCDELVVNHLKTLSAPDAKKLSAVRGNLELNGLKTIDHVAASALASHAGSLALDGLTAIKDPVALALAAHQGPVSLAGVKNPGSIIWSIFLKRGHSPFSQLPPLEAFCIPMSEPVKPAYNIFHQAILRSITPDEFKAGLLKIENCIHNKSPERRGIPKKPAPCATPLDDYLAQLLVSLPFDRMHIPNFFKALKLDFEELETLARGRTPCQILVALRQYTQLDIAWPAEYFKEIELSAWTKVAEIVNSSELTGHSTPSTNLKLWNYLPQ